MLPCKIGSFGKVLEQLIGTSGIGTCYRDLRSRSCQGRVLRRLNNKHLPTTKPKRARIRQNLFENYANNEYFNLASIYTVLVPASTYIRITLLFMINLLMGQS